MQSEGVKTRSDTEKAKAAAAAVSASSASSGSTTADTGTITESSGGIPASGNMSETIVGTVGNTYEFNPSGPQTFDDYVEQLEYFFESNNITDIKKKKSILCTVVGQANFLQLKKIAQPKKTQELEYDEVIKLFKELFNPTPNIWVKRAELFSRIQKEGESITSYLVELKGLSSYCNYETPSSLEQALIQQVLTGMSDQRLKEQILQIEDLTFSKVQQKAAAWESARKSVSAFQATTRSTATAESVNKFQHHPTAAARASRQGGKARRDRQEEEEAGPSQSAPPLSCHRCGDPHKPETCKYRYTTCNFCSKKGHIMRACAMRKTELNKEKKSGKRNVNYVEDPGLDEESTTNFVTGHSVVEPEVREKVAPTVAPPFSYLFSTTEVEEEATTVTPPTSYLYNTNCPGAPAGQQVKVSLDGRDVIMEIDTGSEFSLIGYDTFRKLWPFGASLHPTNLVIKTWSNEILKIEGVLYVLIKCQKVMCMQPLLVMSQPGASLLGRNWFESIGLHLASNNTPTICNTSYKPEFELQNVSTPQCHHLSTHYKKDTAGEPSERGQHQPQTMEQPRHSSNHKDHDVIGNTGDGHRITDGARLIEDSREERDVIAPQLTSHSVSRLVLLTDAMRGAQRGTATWLQQPDEKNNLVELTAASESRKRDTNFVDYPISFQKGEGNLEKKNVFVTQHFSNLQEQIESPEIEKLQRDVINKSCESRSPMTTSVSESFEPSQGTSGAAVRDYMHRETYDPQPELTRVATQIANQPAEQPFTVSNTNFNKRASIMDNSPQHLVYAGVVEPSVGANVHQQDVYRQSFVVDQCYNYRRQNITSTSLQGNCSKATSRLNKSILFGSELIQCSSVAAPLNSLPVELPAPPHSERNALSPATMPPQQHREPTWSCQRAGPLACEPAPPQQRTPSVCRTSLV